MQGCFVFVGLNFGPVVSGTSQWARLHFLGWRRPRNNSVIINKFVIMGTSHGFFSLPFCSFWLCSPGPAPHSPAYSINTSETWLMINWSACQHNHTPVCVYNINSHINTHTQRVWGSRGEGGGPVGNMHFCHSEAFCWGAV